jgi:peptidoglycan/LPS O-acetylase OafA/YrhL
MLPRLSAYTAGRNNNFNFIRLLAASAVLVSHSYTLSTGNPEIEPFARQIGLTLGTIAVDIFFITSGFLVTGSLLARSNIVEFFAARALRIYPGLWVSQILTVAIVGFWLTTEPPRTFFSQWATWHYLLKNCALVRYVDFYLPGTFETAPFSVGGVNSSLWTLPVELRMYVYLGMGWLILRLLRAYSGRAFVIFCVAVAIVGVALDLGHFIMPAARIFSGGSQWTLPGLFFLGAAFRLLQDRIPVSRAVALCMALALLLSLIDPLLFGITYRLTLAYLVIYLALAAGRFPFSPRGDYSYGIYIYAYPIQQAIATLVAGISPAQMIALSGVITFGFAFASWHGVEKHALHVKDRLARRTNAAKVASRPPLSE